jgi:PHD/YefM family antitoxin component YafN of YafNO toxin-antitoxin module
MRITAMPRTISTNDVEDRLSSAISWVEEHGDDVIVETAGHPRAVIMSFTDYEQMRDLRDRVRRGEARKRLHQLKQEVSNRNRDLTDEEAMALADRFVREVIDDLAREGRLVFERDRT